MKYEATHLRGTRWAIRPEGALGTCGWINGEAWTVDYVNARTEREALAKADRYRRPRTITGREVQS